MNYDLIPGKLYELSQDVDIRMNIDNWNQYSKINKGDIILLVSFGPWLFHRFLYKNNIVCFQWVLDSEKIDEILKLVV